LEQKKNNSMGCLVLAIMIIAAALFTFISCAQSAIENSDTPSYNSDDYNNDGSVDMKDGVDKLQQEIDQENKYGDDYSDKTK
jgi:hypothetical protein